MTRMLIASALMTVLAAGSAAAYQTTPPPAKPPATQTPPTAPPTTGNPPPLMQQAPPKPAVPFPADSKVGFVNLQSVVSDSKLGKAGSAQMKTLADSMNSELTSAQNKITALQKEIQSGQGGLLSAAALQSKQSQYEQLGRDFQHLQDNWQAKINDANKNLLESFSEKVVPIVEEIRTEKKLWVVFAVQDSEGGGLAVLAADPGLDLSPEVVKRLDAKFPGTAGGK
jgi:Skp family chaperone for outer membrane proteins